MASKKKSSKPRAVEAELRDFALAYPETHEDFPWGERAIKVKGKVFIFISASDDKISFSVKLPISADMALDQPFTEPTHYGLGKKGWVTSKFEKSDDVPVELVKSWIDESYRAVAPKKLVNSLK